MQQLFRTTGKLHWLEDGNGKPVPKDIAEIVFPVLVDVKYELKPSPHQPLVVEIYGHGRIGIGPTRKKLVLDNGVVLTGRTSGGGWNVNTNEIKKMYMFDVEEAMIELYPTYADSPSPEIDAAVFGVVSSDPLGSGSCSKGEARPGFPFSFRETFPEQRDKMTWSSHALRLHRGDLEMTLVGTSNYWKKFVDLQTLQHDSVIGVRKKAKGVLKWEELNDVVHLLSSFLGWINHCVSPVFHVKGYRKGRLVYRGYDVHPHPTVQRDSFSWLPLFGAKDDNGAIGRHAALVQGLLDGFAKVWDKNEKERGAFHIALQMLRSKEKGSPRSVPSILYLRDIFSACGILATMLAGADPYRSRIKTIIECLDEIGVDEKLPIKARRDEIVQNHPELWRKLKEEKNEQKVVVVEEERKKGTLSRPLANMTNWVLHIDNPTNAKALLSLPRNIQRHFVEVGIWLADLMVMKVVGYCGLYFNRLTMETEVVPWAKGPKTAALSPRNGITGVQGYNPRH